MKSSFEVLTSDFLLLAASQKYGQPFDPFVHVYVTIIVFIESSKHLIRVKTHSEIHFADHDLIFFKAEFQVESHVHF
jgi:hypothetical protein